MASFTVLTPSYNYARFIPEAIESVFAQNLQSPVELVIQDAVSNDGTTEVVKEHAVERNLRFVSEKDSGQSDALNRAFSTATGDIVGWLNADEFYLPGAFSAVDEAFRQNPSAGVIYGDCAFVNEEGKLLRLVPAHSFSRYLLENYGCFISSCATFVRHEVLEDSPWDVSMRRAMDWDLWLSLSSQVEFHYIPKVLAAFRVHPGQVTNVPEAENEEEFLRLRAKHEITEVAWKRQAGRLLHAGYKFRARGYQRQRRAMQLSAAEPLGHWTHESVAAEAATTLARV